MIRKVVLEGCLGDWSKKSYVRNLAEKAGTGKIEFYAVDTRDIEDENGTLYVTPVKFVNKKRDWKPYLPQHTCSEENSDRTNQNDD